MWRPVATFLIAVTLSASCGGTRPASRLSRIRQRGALVCGVFPRIAAFAQVDGQGWTRVNRWALPGAERRRV
jgi:hypothetical protein